MAIYWSDRDPLAFRYSAISKGLFRFRLGDRPEIRRRQADAQGPRSEVRNHIRRRLLVDVSPQAEEKPIAVFQIGSWNSRQAQKPSHALYKEAEWLLEFLWEDDCLVKKLLLRRELELGWAGGRGHHQLVEIP